jgi:tetratricopeptide (TPR) repeat protein
MTKSQPLDSFKTIIMKNTVPLFITIVSLFSFNGYTQKAKVFISENKNFTNIDALKTYERVAEKGYKSADMFKKLGNSYYYNTDLDQAAKWYSELFTLTQDVEPEYYYRYSQCLRALGQNEKADMILEKFNHLSKINTR